MTVEQPPTCIPEKPLIWVPPFEARRRSSFSTINFEDLAFSSLELDGTSSNIEENVPEMKQKEEDFSVMNPIQEDPDLYEESWKQLAEEFYLITDF
ncbi:hypothetical protein SNE40_015308 [Patella caerulea]